MEAETVRVSWATSSRGKAPNRRASASLLASSSSNGSWELPEMTIWSLANTGALIAGAEMT